MALSPANTPFPAATGMGEKKPLITKIHRDSGPTIQMPLKNLTGYQTQ